MKDMEVSAEIEVETDVRYIRVHPTPSPLLLAIHLVNKLMIMGYKFIVETPESGVHVFRVKIR